MPKSQPHNLLPAAIVAIPGHFIENVILEDVDITYGGGASEKIANIGIDHLDQVEENEAGYLEFSMFGELPAWGFYIRHAKGVTFKNVKINHEEADFRPLLVFDDVRDISIHGLKVDKSENKHFIILKNSKIIRTGNTNFPVNDAIAIKSLP